MYVGSAHTKLCDVLKFHKIDLKKTTNLLSSSYVYRDFHKSFNQITGKLRPKNNVQKS